MDLSHTISRDLTSAPRLAGTPADHATAVKLRDFWRDQGLDEVKLVPYDVLLSYPDPNVYNRVELYDRRDKLIFTTRTDSNRSGLVPPFNAYSASGSPKVGHLTLVLQPFHVSFFRSFSLSFVLP